MSPKSEEPEDWAGLGDSGAARDGKLLVGRDGWVFLAYDSNDVLGQHTGKVRFTEKQLERWRRTLDERDAWVRSRAGVFRFFVPPNPHSVFPEMLPEGIESASTRPIHQLSRYLEESGSLVRPIYPVEELVAVKHRLVVYPKTDSHWSAAGAFVGYKRLLDELRGLVELRELGWEDVEFEEVEFVAGLGRKMTPPRSSTQLVGRVLRPSFEVVDDNRIRRTGRIITLACADAPPVSVVLFGDSFSYAMLRYLGETFRRVTFVHLPTLDRSVVEDARADVVISSVNERFAIRVPDDATAPSAAEMFERKKRMGKQMSARKASITSPHRLWP